MMTQLFSEMTATVLPDLNQILYYMRRLPAQKIFFQKIQALSVIKRFWRSLIHILIYFQSFGIKYIHDMNISSFRVGRWNLVRGNPVQSLQRSQTKGASTKNFCDVLYILTVDRVEGGSWVNSLKKSCDKYFFK